MIRAEQGVRVCARLPVGLQAQRGAAVAHAIKADRQGIMQIMDMHVQTQAACMPHARHTLSPGIVLRPALARLGSSVCASGLQLRHDTL